MKTNVYFLPIEPLEERYSSQMLRWVEQSLTELDIPCKTLLPPLTYKNISHGQWLDTYGTTMYRNLQMNMVAEEFQNGNVENGAVFLIGDVWYPGIEAIHLMADLSNIHVRLAGWHYAGTADPADLLSRTLKPWGKEWERWLVEEAIDSMCVGSSFHLNLLSDAFGEHVKWKTHAFGLAWRPNEVREWGRADQHTKQQVIVFPHRLAPEKNPDAFYALARKYKGTGWRFVYSTNNPNLPAGIPSDIEVVVHKDKKSYYEFLDGCSIYYSAATQETFGYSLHESIALGLSVVAPARCSYTEMLRLDSRFLYSPRTDPIGEKLLQKRMDDPVAVPTEYTDRFDRSEKKFMDKVINTWS